MTASGSSDLCTDSNVVPMFRPTGAGYMEVDMEDWTLAPLVRDYIARRRSEGLSRLTLRQNADTLYDFAGSFGRRPLDQLGAAAIQRWLDGHLDTWSQSTRSTRVSCLRRFAEWCELERRTKPWSALVPKVRRPETVPRYVSLDAFGDTLSAATSTRERAILWLLYGLGMRCVEVARLQVQDWDRRSESLIATGKAGNQRRLPVFGPVASALTAYLSEHPVSSGPLIRKVDGGGGLSPNTISTMTRRMIERAGVKEAPYDGVCPHGMRAAAATAILESSGDIRTAQEFLGHRDAGTTSRYLRSVGLASIRAAMESRSYGDAA